MGYSEVLNSLRKGMDCMSKFLFWLKGYVIASIPINNAERFINILPNQNISADRICVKGERCCFRMARHTYLKLNPVVVKTGAYPKLHKKCGGYYLYRRILEHTGLYLGILTFGIILYIMSLFLWDIEFSGNQIHTDEQLLRFVNEYGIGFGSKQSEIDCAGLEAAIRKAYRDIGWVSVEVHGSRMMIRIKEASFTEKQTKTTGEYSHIVADQNGIVTDMIVRSGTPMVTVGDSVKKGDILISGDVITRNEYDEPIRCVTVYADGEVKLKSELSYRDSVPLRFMMNRVTGNQKTGCSVSIFNKKIFSYIPSIPYERYDIITTSVNWKISKNLYLPVSHDTISCVEYKQSEAIYSNAQLSELCYRRYLNWIETYLINGYSLIRDDVNLQIIEDECVLQGTLMMEGPFWKRVEAVRVETEGVTAE